MTAPVPLDGPGQFVPLLTMGPGFVLQASRFYMVPITAAVPPGPYELFVLITSEGALQKAHLAAGDIILVEAVTFEVLP
jgi:hypothetical protein